MKISVIVPAFNEEKLIGSTLQSIKAAASAWDAIGWTYEIIVCNNNSTDRTAELAAAQGATVVFEPINQISRARNTGTRHATGDWVLFIDADSQPSAPLFAEFAKAIQGGECLGGGSTVKLEHGYPVGQFITSAWNLLSRLTKWAPGSFIFSERASFLKIGGFSEKLFVAEELELSQRLKSYAKQQGKRLIILHRHPLLTSARKMHLYSRSEHLRFLARTILRIGRPLRNRDECFVWYDGRR